MMLKLEYSCTEAELKEAQALNDSKNGPKWRAILYDWGFLAIMAVIVFWYKRSQITPQDRFWIISFVLLVLAAYFIKPRLVKWMTKAQTNDPVHVEVSEQGLAFTGPHRLTMAWGAFSACLESATVFVLVSRNKELLYTVPKRAFPDETAQNWFRALATQPPIPSGTSSETIVARPSTQNGIKLTVHLGFGDCLNRITTSWKMKGMALGILGLCVGTCLIAPEPPHPIHTRGEALVTILAIMIPMLAVLAPVVAFLAWLMKRKTHTTQHLVLNSEGIFFDATTASGFLPWSGFKYYLENRWAFFVWQGSIWFMMPKRTFASQTEVDQCRELLRTNLKASRWFYG